MVELTKEEAVALADSEWWHWYTCYEIAWFQLNQPRLCMPFGLFHKALEESLECSVQTIQFAFLDLLVQAFTGIDCFDSIKPELESVTYELIVKAKELVGGKNE